MTALRFLARQAIRAWIVWNLGITLPIGCALLFAGISQVWEFVAASACASAALIWVAAVIAAAYIWGTSE